jgi:hypothetical protein
MAHYRSASTWAGSISNGGLKDASASACKPPVSKRNPVCQAMRSAVSPFHRLRSSAESRCGINNVSDVKIDEGLRLGVDRFAWAVFERASNPAVARSKPPHADQGRAGSGVDRDLLQAWHSTEQQRIAIIGSIAGISDFLGFVRAARSATQHRLIIAGTFDFRGLAYTWYPSMQ